MTNRVNKKIGDIYNSRIFNLYAFVIILVVYFYLFQSLLFITKVVLPVYFLLLVPVIFSFIGAKYTDKCFPVALKIIYRTILSLFIFYVLTSDYFIHEEIYPELTYIDKLMLSWGSYLIAILGVIGYRRPVFGMFPFIYVLYIKYLYSRLFGFFVSGTDYLAVMEAGLFIIIGFVAIKKLSESEIVKKMESTKNQLENPFYVLFFLTIASHFANYFYSAIDKMLLDTNIFTWAIENNTHYIMMVSDISKTLMLDFSNESKALVHNVVNKIVPIINWSTLIIQIIAVIGLARIRLAIIITLLYDIMHIIIFIVSGIFFWKWIILNLAIVAALTTIRKKRVPLNIVLLCSLFTLISPFLFNTAFLGWYDTKSLNRVYFIAKTKSGSSYDVPSNYFFAPSIAVAQQRDIGQPHYGHYELRAYGNIEAADINLMYQANECKLPLAGESGVSKEHSAYESVSKFIKNHHKYILGNINDEGKLLYDLYPHHIWSNPLSYKEFYHLDKRDIVAYEFVVESGCINFDGKEVLFDVKLKGGYEINVSDIKGL